jgi:CRP-like cAMP-binding protein
VDIVLKLADGSEKLLVKLTDGRFFGELALLENAPRTATAVVRKPTVLLGLFRSDLESLIERNSKLGAGVIWNLAKLIGARLVELSTAVRTQAAKQEGAK